jgi:eukaryotic-like serine/threonine-protein kinase
MMKESTYIYDRFSRRMSNPTLPPALLASRFVLERELGRGGMATVYLARETKHERQVAIKVLHPEVSAAFGAERFLREIGIAARLSHPHLVPLIDSGEADGVLYYISAFIPGGSLRDRLERDGPLPLRDALRIAEEVGAGLGFAHRAGFVHRDVKPENILFADGHALLADFGIARAVCEVDEARMPEEHSVTDAGIAVGTPAYMSPEQAAGERQLDARSDVYSLGCVVFEMLAGEPPFAARSSRQVMSKHIAETPRRLRTIRPEVPASVDDAIHRALQKDPAQRWASVSDFAAALHVESSPRARVSAGKARGIAVLPFVNASPEPENEYLSDGLTDELINALAKVEGIRVASRTSVFALKDKPQDVRAIGALLDCAYVLEGTVRRVAQQLRITAQLTSTDDGGLLWSQRYDRKLDDVFAIQDEISQTIVNTLRSSTFGELLTPSASRHTSNVRAYSLYLKGRFDMNLRTQAGVASAIRYFQQAIEEDPNYALAYTGLADSYALELDYRSIPVHEGLDLAKKFARKAIELDDTLAEPHASLGWRYFIYDWDWDAAMREFRRSIDLDPRYSWSHQLYGFVLSCRGQHSEAIVEGHTAVELDPGAVSARRALGWQYYYARRWDQARFHLDRAIAMNPNAEETYRVLGHTLAVEGDYGEAERVLREAASMPEAGTYTRATLGYALARAGQVAEARRILAELTSEGATGYVSPVAFATIHVGLGEIDRALDWAERALDERRGWLCYLKVNPLMDPMRGHPRFAALIERMRL